MSRVRAPGVCLVLLVAACGTVPPGADDATVPSDAAIDAQAPDAAPTDAAADAPLTPPPPGQEVVSGAARLQSTTYLFDVQIGHPYAQHPSSNATHTLEGNAVVRP